MRIRQNRPVVDLTNADLSQQIADVFDALEQVNKQDPTLFSQNGRLVVCEIVDSDLGEQLRQVANVDHAVLRTWLSFHIDFQKWVGGQQGGLAPALPSAPLLDALINTGEWRGVPDLRDISEMPIVTRTGEVVEQRGYHPSTRIFLGPLDPLPLLDAPPPEHVARAKELLLVDVLGDFAFKEEEDRANALGAILTAPTRFMYDCTLPLHLFDSTNPGSGKGTLAAVIGEMWGGSMLQPASEDEEEFRKKILPALAATERVIIFDNVEHTLGGPNWNALLTTPEWSDRVLGSSKSITLPNNKLWCATGNNIALGRDMPRRCVWVMQDPKQDPSKRTMTDFRHPDIVNWVREQQPMLRWAVLTLIKHWIAEGMPEANLSCDNMTPWARTVGGILETVGVSGFLRDRLKGGAMDEETVELLNFIDAVGTVFGNGAEWTVREVVDRIADPSRMGDSRTLQDNLPGRVRNVMAKNGAIAMSLGKYVERNLGRFAGPSGARLRHGATSTPRSRTYIVEGAQGIVVPTFTGF